MQTTLEEPKKEFSARALYRELSNLNKEKQYVNENTSKEFYINTIDKAMACKHVNNIDRAVAGPYYLRDMWMLHNALIDFNERGFYHLARTLNNVSDKFVDEWFIVMNEGK